MDKIRLHQKHMGDLHIFKVLDIVMINKRFIISYKNPLYLVSYTYAIEENMHGDIEPLGIFNYAGSRKYIFNNEYYKDSSAKIDMQKIERIEKSVANKNSKKDNDIKILEYLQKIIDLIKDRDKSRPIIFSRAKTAPAILTDLRGATRFVCCLQKIQVT